MVGGIHQGAAVTTMAFDHPGTGETAIRWTTTPTK